MLIYHLKNHYACIFAVREFKYRPGQREALFAQVWEARLRSSSLRLLGRSCSVHCSQAQQEQEEKDQEDRAERMASGLGADDEEDDEGEDKGAGSAAPSRRSSLVEVVEGTRPSTNTAPPWADEGDGIGRQILTARKGQRPKTWVNYEDAFDLIARKKVHCILACYLDGAAD